MVVPIFSEHELQYLEMENVKNLIENADKIVVNDVGLLRRLKGQKIRLGRLMFKDYKDQRYEKFDGSEYNLKLYTIIGPLKSMGYNIKEIECDIATKEIVADIDEDIKIYFHYPYRQVSCSHICEFGSINKRITEKFQPDSFCTKECKNVMIKTKNPKYLKIGKGIYDEINEEYIQNFSKNINWIITPRWS